jgi:DNA adenine methylase
MKVATQKLRSPLKWHGGKSYLARRIIALMPEHRAYVEPFLGGGSILLNKPKAELEVAGDLNRRLVNFWEYVGAGDVGFLSVIQGTEYCLKIFELAKAAQWLSDNTPRHEAIYFMVANRFSRGGLGQTFAWSERLRGGQPGDVNAWETIKAELPEIAARLADVRFNCCEARKLMAAYDGPETLHYLDPPYLHETRTAKKAYGEFEMDPDDHVRLLVAARSCRGAVLISGYRSKSYDSFLGDWHRVEIEMPNHSGQGKSKQRRVECIWSNRPFPGEAS